MQEIRATELEAIFWDFDGVILNSNSVRDRGFEEVLTEYPPQEVAALMDFHQANGGLSRYVKFRYFFENIRGEAITADEVKIWAERFSLIMKKLLPDPSLLIQETVSYIKSIHGKVPQYIVSGSDQEELRYLCAQLGIATYFERIHGSPTPKTNWVKTILKEEQHQPASCILVGDSINDREAAFDNQIHFMGYNNPPLAATSTKKLSFKRG